MTTKENQEPQNVCGVGYKLSSTRFLIKHPLVLNHLICQQTVVTIKFKFAGSQVKGFHAAHMGFVFYPWSGSSKGSVLMLIYENLYD